MNEMKIKRGTDVVAIGGETAVLAKELATIKRTPSPAASPSIKPRWSSSETVVISKSVAVPRSVAPVVVVEKQSDPVQSASKDNPVVIHDAPLPTKRLSHLTSPSALPRKSIRPVEKPEDSRMSFLFTMRLYRIYNRISFNYIPFPVF